MIWFPTASIEGDLRSRKILEPSVRELVALYLDPALSDRERLALKSRIVVAGTSEPPSREVLVSSEFLVMLVSVLAWLGN